ncbi:MAG: caspase family protein, partial [Pseudomonadota bacterium]
MIHKFIVIILILLISACQARTIKEQQRAVIRPQPSFSKQPLALVIGNLRYEHNPLDNPVNDATDMGRLLEGFGFEVIVKIDLNQRAMEDAIRDFARRLSESRGIGVFYFAGHGAQVGGRNYLLPIDNNRIQDEIDLEKSAVYVDEILKRMEDAKTILNVVILDACRDNPYRGGRSLRRGFAPMLSNSLGSIIAFATAPGRTAADSNRKGGNGLFTSHLLSALKKAYETHQRLDDMFMGVHNAVARESGGRQMPWYSASLSEPFCFGGCKTASTERKNERQGADREGSPAPKMVLISAGRFEMGDIQGGGGDDELPVHEVSVSGFAISRYEITFADYDRFAQATGRDKPDDEGWGRGSRPVINVSWHEAQAYTEWLSQETGDRYRLPTEAEWEYAARAGTKTRYW